MTLQIERLKDLHSIGYMHNDLKLENILIGHRDPSKIYLIDFGLSQKYLDDDGSHIKKQNLGYFSGNFMFASVNSCKGNSKSRRDDMESLFYLLIYLMSDHELPWAQFTGSIQAMVTKRLDKEITRKVFKMMPCNFYKLMINVAEIESTYKSCLLTDFDQEPNYEYITNSFKRAY